MKNSLYITAFFLTGILAGSSGFVPEEMPVDLIILGILYVLMGLIGFSFGSDPRLPVILRSISLKMLLVPVTTITGTFLGIIVFNLFFPHFGLRDSLAISAGFGYYSLSSVLIEQFSGGEMATIALLANVAREIITLLLAPVISRYFGKLAPIASAGATSMDTTLPVIIKSSGMEYMLISLTHGILLTVMVPFIISVIYQF